MKGLGLLILALCFVGCNPTTKVRTAGVDSDGSVAKDPLPPSTSDVALAWYQNFSTLSNLTVYHDTPANAYWRGTKIENYLISINSPTTSYCLEIDMGASIPLASKRYYRVRGVPVSVNDLAGAHKTLYMRFDLSNSAAGSAVCAKDKLEYIDDTTTQVVTWASSTARTTFETTDLCLSCMSQATTGSMKLYTVDTTANQLVQIKRTVFEVTSLQFTLKPGNSPTSGPSCDTTTCAALGYSCCLQNQCVKDGAIRNDADTASSAFNSAEAEKLTNPLAFLKYPQFYYVCGTNQTPTTTTTTPADNVAARLTQLRADYACVQHLKTNAAYAPYLQSPFTPVVTDQSICSTMSTTSDIYYATVLNRLYTNCGCSSSYTTLDDRITHCPKFDYTVLASDSSGLPLQLGCTTLPSSTTSSGYQKVSVSSRSVPHRYFNSSGTETDLSASGAVSSTIQEGTKFYYTDQERQRPQNGSFNMNSVLGTMSATLTPSQPAKVVSVDLDQVYLINTLSGNSTPCPTCAKDHWYASFSPHPTTSYGLGLKAVGFSTQRNSWDNNITLGNYEDTIFGRACWVPPTMLPFSQPLDLGNVQTQRLTRLKAQATMWINGYQRDWYGFNKGALIGSFDGVSWFAIGKGRIIRSTTKKLFLAVNAPFGDLASNNAHVVTVQPYDGQSDGANLDYDPAYTNNDPRQSEAATCQQYHACSVDSDCITRLGWEYTCADVSQLRSYWPTFDPSTATELASTSPVTAVGIEGVLGQRTLPSGSTKRCVYRGAGAVCRTDSGNIASSDMQKRRLLTCAPNFWCADVDSTNAVVPSTGAAVKVFNQQIARFDGAIETVPTTNNHLYGRDTNFLGRPLDYVHTTGGSTNLVQISDTVVRSTINNNVKAMDASADGKVGLCRPGKRLPTSTDVTTQFSPFAQHQALDSYSRTDFISQVGSCPANYLSLNKNTSCPVLDSDGNYVHFTTGFDDAINVSNSVSWAALASVQNSCGLETLKTGTVVAGHTADQLQAYSPFQSIEAKPLNSQVVTAPTLARDACLRKAGSVCHTDLDCGPNKMHAEQSAYFTDSYFGNLPNRQYYEEYLVCGQEQPKPYLSDAAFATYDMTLNRCCREVGNDISTYSTDEPLTTSTDETDSSGLDPLRKGAVEPTYTGRYERLASVPSLGTGYPMLTAYDDRNGAGTLSIRSFGSPAVVSANVRTSKQWQTLDVANAKTCCGGGWIRKFSDGTTDWTKRDRLRVDPSNFRCLNYISPLVDAADPTLWGLTQAQIDTDYVRYCTDVNGVTGNCAQLSIPAATNLTTAPSCSSREYEPAGTNPYSALGQAQFSTLPGEVSWTSAYNIFSFFPPTTADDDTGTTIDFSTSGRRNITFFMPSYVGNSAFSVVMQRRDSTNTLSEVTCSAVATGIVGGSTDVGTCADGGGAGGCCYEYTAATRLLKVALNQTGANGFYDATTSSGNYGVKITYTPPGINVGILAKAPCTDYYYLDLLGKFELSGIPQITHPKILCNSNADRLVPGLYDILDGDSNRSNFNTSTNGFLVGTDWHTNYRGLATEPVFSAHDFKCCTPLGKLTKNATTCCSGTGVAYTDPNSPPGERQDYRCVIPTGADMNVYFNRFVSNEGMGTPGFPSSVFVTTDFDSQTGELLPTSSVSAKLSVIGTDLCEKGKTRRGGAFGAFAPEPSSVANGTSTVYGIVDSPSDTGSMTVSGGTVEVGYNAFMQGFRWNHHLYCTE